MSFTLKPAEFPGATNLASAAAEIKTALADNPASSVIEPAFPTQAKANALAVELRKLGGLDVRVRTENPTTFYVHVRGNPDAKPRVYKEQAQSHKKAAAAKAEAKADSF